MSLQKLKNCLVDSGLPMSEADVGMLAEHAVADEEEGLRTDKFLRAHNIGEGRRPRVQFALRLGDVSNEQHSLVYKTTTEPVETKRSARRLAGDGMVRRPTSRSRACTAQRGRLDVYENLRPSLGMDDLRVGRMLTNPTPRRLRGGSPGREACRRAARGARARSRTASLVHRPGEPRASRVLRAAARPGRVADAGDAAAAAAAPAAAAQPAAQLPSRRAQRAAGHPGPPGGGHGAAGDARPAAAGAHAQGVGANAAVAGVRHALGHRQRRQRRRQRRARRHGVPGGAHGVPQRRRRQWRRRRRRRRRRRWGVWGRRQPPSLGLAVVDARVLSRHDTESARPPSGLGVASSTPRSDATTRRRPATRPFRSRRRRGTSHHGGRWRGRRRRSRLTNDGPSNTPPANARSAPTPPQPQERMIINFCAGQCEVDNDRYAPLNCIFSIVSSCILA